MAPSSAVDTDKGGAHVEWCLCFRLWGQTLTVRESLLTNQITSETDRLEAKQLRICLLSKRDEVLGQKSKSARTNMSRTKKRNGKRETVGSSNMGF